MLEREACTWRAAMAVLLGHCGDDNALAQLQVEPEHDGVADAIRAELDVQRAAAAVLGRAGHVEVPGLDRLRQRPVHGVRQGHACLDIGWAEVQTAGVVMLLREAPSVIKSWPSVGLSVPSPAVKAGVQRWRLTALMSSPHTVPVRTSAACMP